MTSDRGTTGEAEMQLSNTPVTPKAAGLNPNANVFHSKSPSTPPEPSVDWPDTDTTSTTTSTPEGVLMVNGDGGKVGTVAVSFPPTPESPMQIPDYSTLNGTTPSVSEVLFSPTNSNEDVLPLDDINVQPEDLRAMLKNQLEYYFSRDNLASDSYLVSQMDADQYVPIATVAGFNQIKRLTNDVNLVVDVLRESSNVQVDEKGEKVRPLHKRCIVILREVPDSTPVSEVEKLFTGENCPRFISCEFAHNNSWYVTFDSDEDAQRAYQYLREDVRNFLGRPIMARIKAKPLLRSTFVPKNGFKTQYDPNLGYTGQRAYTAFAQVPSSTQYILTPQQTTVTQSPPQPQPQPPPPPPPPQPGAQQQQSYPFFPPSTVMHAAWPSNAMPFFDPGTAFAANGYTPTGTFKLTSNTSRHTGYANMRNRNQLKSHNRGSQSGGDRNSNDTMRMQHDRHTPAGGNLGSRNSPRSDSGHLHIRSSQHNNQHSNHSHPHSYSHSHAHTSGPRRETQQGHSHPTSSHSSTSSSGHHGNGTDPNTSAVASNRQSEVAVKDQTTQPLRRGYRSRRRREEDGPRTSRQSSAQLSAKETKTTVEMPKFELESTSFPPLPGSTNSTTTGDVFENKMSDVVKGTAKPLTREIKPATPPATTTTSTTATSTVATTTSSPSPAASRVPTTTTQVTAPVTTPASTASPASTTQTQASQVVPSSPCKEKEINGNVNPVKPVSLPTPPPSPQKTEKVSKSTSTDIVPPVPVASKADAATSTNATTQTSAQPQKPTSDSLGPVRLSYAQMAQRAKERAEREAAERQKPSAEESNKEKETPAATTSPAAGRPSTLRDQTQMPSTRPSACLEARKGEEPRELRLGLPVRRAKENRDRRDLRDLRDPRERERERDRFRDRRRDRDLEAK